MYFDLNIIESGIVRVQILVVISKLSRTGTTSMRWHIASYSYLAKNRPTFSMIAILASVHIHSCCFKAYSHGCEYRLLLMNNGCLPA